MRDHAGARVLGDTPRGSLSSGRSTHSAETEGHTREVLSPDPDTMRDPSGENDTEYTQPVWPSSGPRTPSPDTASHTRTVSSSDPDTMRDPSGENDTEHT